MSKTPWTPAPWFAELGHGIGNTDWTGTVPIDSNSWGSLARVMVTMDGDISGEGVANAHLIAAAPDMASCLGDNLDSAKRVLSELSYNEESDDLRETVCAMIEDIEAVLAKAMGEQ